MQIQRNNCINKKYNKRNPCRFGETCIGIESLERLEELIIAKDAQVLELIEMVNLLEDSVNSLKEEIKDSKKERNVNSKEEVFKEAEKEATVIRLKEGIKESLSFKVRTTEAN